VGIYHQKKNNDYRHKDVEDGLETKDQTSTQYFDAKIIYNKQQTMFILAGRQNQTSRGGLSSDPRKDHVKVHFYYLQLE